MFVTEVGAVITTVLLFTGGQGASFGFLLQITLWLWFTVLFANFAEAMAEGRGKAQADTLRKARTETTANRCLSDGGFEQIPSSTLHKDDVVVVQIVPWPVRSHTENATVAPETLVNEARTYGPFCAHLDWQLLSKESFWRP